MLALKTLGYKIIVVEQTTESVPLNNFAFDKHDKICLVFGNEINGVNQEVITLADAAIEIPQSGTKHSLNVSVCLGIVVWEFFRKISLTT